MAKRSNYKVPKILRAAILERDGHKCQMPGCKKDSSVLTVHHIEPRESGGDEPENLITLHRSSHGIVEMQKKIFGIDVLKGERLIPKEEQFEWFRRRNAIVIHDADYWIRGRWRHEDQSFGQEEVDFGQKDHKTVQRITPQLPPSQEDAKKKGWWQFCWVG